MLKARQWLLLSALVALGRPAAADAIGGGDFLPTRTWPALSAAPLVYVLVINPIRAHTWAERQIEEIRVGARGTLREDASPISRFVLCALHTQVSVAYALEMMEAPGEPDPAGPEHPSLLDLVAPMGLPRAIEAMGLTRQDLLGTPEIPPIAFTLAATLLGLFDWGLARPPDLSEGVVGTSLQIDPEGRGPAPVKAEVEEPPLVFTKKIVRSLYKILLGVAIGLLIWGFVRNTT